MNASRLPLTALGWLGIVTVEIAAAARLPGPPILKVHEFQRGDTITLEVDSATAPSKPSLIELSRGGHTLYLAVTYQAPAAAGQKGTTTAKIGDISFGTFAGSFIWEDSRFELGSIKVQPPGNPAVHLKELIPDKTYEFETAYVPDPSDRTAQRSEVADYSLPSIDRSKLSDLLVRRRDGVLDVLLTNCAYAPPLGSENNPVAPPTRVYARDDNGTIELCGVPTDAKVETANNTRDVDKKQVGNSRVAWFSNPQKSLERKVARVTLHGSGFQVGNPRDNTIWIDGVRQEGVVWDSCSDTTALGARNAPRPLSIHGEVISSEQIQLCSVPVPRSGQVLLAVSYGDNPSESAMLRVFGMGRGIVAAWSLSIALVLALLPLLLLSFVRESYRIGAADYKWRMLFLDQETNTYSLSKLQFYLWTNASLFSYAYLFISRVKVQFAVWPDIPSTLPGIIAVAGGTAVASQVVTSMRGSKGSGEEAPSFADFITSGGVVAADRLQMLLWTLFGVGAFMYSVWQLEPGTISDLPPIPDRLLVLMGISSAGYLGGKMARKPGPVINEISIIPTASDAAILKASTPPPEIPDLIQATVAAQQKLAVLNAMDIRNTSAKAAIDAFAQAVKNAAAARGPGEFSQVLVALAGGRKIAEDAAAKAAEDFSKDSLLQAQAEAAQSAAAGLQDFAADFTQAISLASAAPMSAETSPELIPRIIEIRGTNLSPQGLFEIDHEDLPFRMMLNKDGQNAPEVLARDDTTPTFAGRLRLTVDPAHLESADQAQCSKWFSNDGHHTFTLTNPDGQKSDISFDLPPGAVKKDGSK